MAEESGTVGVQVLAQKILELKSCDFSGQVSVNLNEGGITRVEIYRNVTAELREGQGQRLTSLE